MILGMKRKINFAEGSIYPNYVLNNLYFKVNKFILEDKKMQFKLDLVSEDEVEFATEIIRKQNPYDRTYLEISYINENKLDEKGLPITPLEDSQKIVTVSIDIMNNFLEIELNTINLTMEEFNEYVGFINNLSI